MTRLLPESHHAPITAETTLKHKPGTVLRIPGGHGAAFKLKTGTHFRIVDLHGEQVIDMLAWVADSPSPMTTGQQTKKLILLPIEYLSMSHTRYHLSGVVPVVGEDLYTNASRPLLRVVADTVKTHDMTFMCCHPQQYEDLGAKGHRSCAENVAEAVSKLVQCAKIGVAELFTHEDCEENRDSAEDMWAVITDEERTAVEGEAPYMHYLQVPDPFNVFQNTPHYTGKALGSSRPGDFIEFEVLHDSVIALSCCPFDMDGFNGGKSTDVEVIINP